MFRNIVEIRHLVCLVDGKIILNLMLIKYGVSLEQKCLKHKSDAVFAISSNENWCLVTREMFILFFFYTNYLLCILKMKIRQFYESPLRCHILQIITPFLAEQGYIM